MDLRPGCVRENVVIISGLVSDYLAHGGCLKPGKWLRIAGMNSIPWINAALIGSGNIGTDLFYGKDGKPAPSSIIRTLHGCIALPMPN